MSDPTAALRLAAKQFREYENSHLSKQTEDGDRKAKINGAMADAMELALQALTPLLKQDRKYRFGMINRVSGEAIPEDEPTFIFRARDQKALKHIIAYQADCDEEHHRQAIEESIEAFKAFQAANPHRMKEPGITKDFRLEKSQPVFREGPIIVSLERQFDHVTAIWSDGERTSLDLRNYPHEDEATIRGRLQQKRLEGK